MCGTSFSRVIDRGGFTQILPEAFFSASASQAQTLVLQWCPHKTRYPSWIDRKLFSSLVPAFLNEFCWYLLSNENSMMNFSSFDFVSGLLFGCANKGSWNISGSQCAKIRRLHKLNQCVFVVSKVIQRKINQAYNCHLSKNCYVSVS